MNIAIENRDFYNVKWYLCVDWVLCSYQCTQCHRNVFHNTNNNNKKKTKNRICLLRVFDYDDD